MTTNYNSAAETAASLRIDQDAVAELARQEFEIAFDFATLPFMQLDKTGNLAPDEYFQYFGLGKKLDNANYYLGQLRNQLDMIEASVSPIDQSARLPFGTQRAVPLETWGPVALTHREKIATIETWCETIRSLCDTNGIDIDRYVRKATPTALIARNEEDRNALLAAAYDALGMDPSHQPGAVSPGARPAIK